jgi:hypothetical protein
MRYEFPEIRHLDDVRPAIEGRDEFIIAERPWGYVVNYMVNLIDTFPEVRTTGGSAKMRAEQNRIKAIRRECRGILFYPDGRIMARRLQKFFNVGERDETQAHLIDLTQPHVILEKLDGCLSADTIVQTPYGEMTIEQLVFSDQEIPVMAYDHTIGCNVWAHVEGTSVKESINNWYKITLDDGKTIKLTDNHKVWCVNKNQYLTVADLEEGDEVRLLTE